MNERGFALPITLFLIAILTLMLGSAFTRAASESQIAGGSKATVDALFVAEAGLQKYLGQDFTSVNRPLSGDSVRMDVPGGWAWIVPEVLQTPADTMDNFRYIIRSTGYAADPSQGSTPLATHTVAQFADWHYAWLNAPPAALIAANGVEDRAGRGGARITGSDLTNCMSIPAITGVRVPADVAVPPFTYINLSVIAPTGTPGTNRWGTPLSLADTAGVNWQAIISGAYEPDATSWENWRWQNESRVITGDLNITGTWPRTGGSGILIVTGNLNITSGFWTWTGIILVGGNMTISTRFTSSIIGTVITGLNTTVSAVPLPRTILTEPRFGNLVIQFSSCDILNALQSAVGFTPIENTWIDNWATF